jgi:DNA processing protein
VSGGAYGCDITAHKGVLASKKSPLPAILVFASGLGRLSPDVNHSVFSELKQGSAVFLSERLFFQPAHKFDFPIRNRVIAGISPRLFVMQSQETSGTTITAKAAADFGREVCVLRHPKHDVRGLGNETLLADGALALNDFQQI